MRFELMTSSLPRKRSTPELHWLFKSGRRGSNPRPSAWKADALPTELLPRFIVLRRHLRRRCSSFASSHTRVCSGAHSSRFLNLPPQNDKTFNRQTLCALDSLPLWGEKDSNLRRRAPADLQSAPVGHFGISPYSCHSMNLSR